MSNSSATRIFEVTRSTLVAIRNHKKRRDEKKSIQRVVIKVATCLCAGAAVVLREITPGECMNGLKALERY